MQEFRTLQNSSHNNNVKNKSMVWDVSAEIVPNVWVEYKELRLQTSAYVETPF